MQFARIFFWAHRRVGASIFCLGAYARIRAGALGVSFSRRQNIPCGQGSEHVDREAATKNQLSNIRDRRQRSIATDLRIC